MEHVRINGVDVAYRRAGTGPPIVFVHGAAEDSRTWTPQFEALHDDFTVVAWDEPGGGQSGELPAEGFELADYAACLAGVIDSVRLGPAHVVGLSWGSTIALELFHRHPEAVATLILTGAYAGWKGSLPADEVAARLAGVERMLDAPPEHFDPTFPGLFAGEPPASFVPLLHTMAADVRRHSMRNALSIMAGTDLNFVLPTISVPTLLVWGELDARSPLRIAHEFERTIPNATLVVIPECGHVTNLDRPDEFNRAARVLSSPLAVWRLSTARIPRSSLAGRSAARLRGLFQQPCLDQVSRTALGRTVNIHGCGVLPRPAPDRRLRRGSRLAGCRRTSMQNIRGVAVAFRDLPLRLLLVGALVPLRRRGS